MFKFECKLPPNRASLIPLPMMFQDVRCRTDTYLYSFFPDATSMWNNILSSFEQLPTFLELKNSLFRHKGNSIFGIHDPFNIRYIFQLRVGLSKPRSYKK